MLSLTCKAAIKAVIFLGSRIPDGQRASVKQIAEYIGENEHTVGKLLQKLVKEGLICSAKGPNGGFHLTPRQADQQVMRIVEAVDGKEIFKQCGLGLSKCSDARPCPIHEAYKPIREQFRQLCEGHRIRDLYQGVNSGLAYLVG